MAILRSIALFNLGVIAGAAALTATVIVFAMVAFEHAGGFALVALCLCGMSIAPIVACRRDRLFWFGFILVGLALATGALLD